MKSINYCLFALMLFIIDVVPSECTVLAHRHRQWNNVQDEIEGALRSFLRRVIKPKSRWRYHHEHHRPEPRVNLYDDPWFEVDTTTTKPTPPPTTAQPTLKPTAFDRRPNVPAFPRFPDRIDRNADGSEFAEKPGICPAKPSGPWACSSRCSLDSDCRGSKKCCRNRCGAMACIPPSKIYDDIKYPHEDRIDYME